jgi:hypothetical protein
MIAINGSTLNVAAAYVDECAQVAEIHTVTLITNGAVGGVDVKIEGTTPKGDGPTEADYERTFNVSVGEYV